MLKTIIGLLMPFKGPIGGLIEKGMLAAVAYLIGKGIIVGDAATIAGALYAAFSVLVTSVLGTQTADIKRINDTEGNGVRVVSAADARANDIPKAETPLPPA